MKYTADTKPGMGDPYWYEWSVGQKYIIDMLNPDNEIKHVELQADVALGLVSPLDASVSLLSVFSESASFAFVSSLSVVSSVAVSVSVFATTGLVPIRVAEIVSADINNVNERFFMIIFSPLSSYFYSFFYRAVQSICCRATGF